MTVLRISVLTIVVSAAVSIAAIAGTSQAGNLGYNSVEGYMSGGNGLNKNFGPGVGYPAETGDYMRRYLPASEWGQYGYGTGHLGEGYGPYIYSNRSGSSPPGMFDPLPGPYRAAPPPSIKIRRGMISVGVPSGLPGVCRVTVTMVAFNNAELCTQSIEKPPYQFVFPVVDGVKNVRVKIDYVNHGLSATSYPL